MIRWISAGSIVLVTAACEPNTASYGTAPSASPAPSSSPTGGVRISGYGRVGVSVSR